MWIFLLYSEFQTTSAINKFNSFPPRISILLCYYCTEKEYNTMKYPIYLPVCSSTTKLQPTQWWTLYYHIVSKNKNDKCFVTKYTCANIIPYACKLILSINIKFLNMQPTTFSRLYNKMLPKLENNCRFRAGGIWLPIHSVLSSVCVCSMCMPHLEAIFGHLDIPTHMKQLDQTFSYETKESIKESQRATFSFEKHKN